LLAGCTTPKPREIVGRLVQPRTGVPIAAQQLDLDRPPGNYVGVPMFLVGVPQPVAIATTTTDQNGRFRFVTTKDRGRFLNLRLAGRQPSDFRSEKGYAIESLQDSLWPSSPHVDFDTRVIHSLNGGFSTVP
jgi:hypothetical protein